LNISTPQQKIYFNIQIKAIDSTSRKILKPEAVANYKAQKNDPKGRFCWVGEFCNCLANLNIFQNLSVETNFESE
jgi:hypothetical protein